MSDGRQAYLRGSTVPADLYAELAERLGHCSRPRCDLILTRLAKPRPDGRAFVCVCCDVGDGKECPHKARGPAGPSGS